jgi:hypothetical protein
MKVICIKDKFKSKHNFDPKIGDELTVIECLIVEGCPCYKFKEIDSEVNMGDVIHEYWFDVYFFAPIDDFKKEEIEEELNNIFEVKREVKR